MKCEKCGGMLHRVVSGNIVDYRHPEGSCPPQPVRLLEPEDVWEPAARRYRDLKAA
jgi:hypothetical protein